MANGNPLISQGTLNRIRASVSLTDYPALNVTASFLAKEGVSLAIEGEMTTFVPTLTGAATSGEPYVMCTLTLNLLRTQGLASSYKSQMEASTQIGEITVKPDATTLPDYVLENCAIEGVQELMFNGTDPGYRVRIRGYYLINNNLWS